MLSALLVSVALIAQADGTASEAAPQSPSKTVQTPDLPAAIAYLRQTQNDDGSWGEAEQVGMSSLVLSSLLRSGVAANDPTVAEGLEFLKNNRRDDGGIYSAGTLHRNYDTALALVALQAAGVETKSPVIQKGVAFLKGLQWDESEGIQPGNEFYGGAGYGGHSRPDMSNTQVLVEALKQSGLSSDDPALQKALIFISRSQNLDSEHNRTKFAGLVGDGGFYYTPAAGGTSQAGMEENGGLRSYASMTYAGLKSMVYAGLDKDDPRVKAATEWIRKNYALDKNPGLDQQGLFYYYVTFAKTMNAIGEEQFVSADGVSHEWADELKSVLALKQQADGSWVNPADRWLEGDKRLVTAYSLLALSYVD